MQPRHALRFAILPAIVPLLVTAGCNKKETPPPPAKPAGPPTVSDADITKYKPNEAGAIMVVMYHRILADEKDTDLNRRPETFRHDLETLKAEGYYPVTALEMVENKMEVPPGKTPVVLTFDDALPSQFAVVTGSDGKPHIDPNCAVGIMETFTKANPDWPVKATFFVLPQEGKNSAPFGQTETVSDKLGYLRKHGHEIANHTSTHNNMRHMTAEKVQWELATAYRDIKTLAPQAAMETFAIPYGALPRGDEARKALEAGSNGGTSYKNKAVFLAAWRPILSPVTKLDNKKMTEGGQFVVFDPYRLERVTPDARHATSPGTFEYWLAYFKKNPQLRYVSDGQPEIVTVPASYKGSVDTARVKAQGKTLQVYGGGSGPGGAGGSSLSVE